MNGGTPVFVPLRAPAKAADSNISSHEWRLDIDELRSKITSKTKMIVLNTPHNPVGKVFDEQELLAIGQVAEEKNLIILSDEVVCTSLLFWNMYTMLTGHDSVWSTLLSSLEQVPSHCHFG